MEIPVVNSNLFLMGKELDRKHQYQIEIFEKFIFMPSLKCKKKGLLLKPVNNLSISHLMRTSCWNENSLTKILLKCPRLNICKENRSNYTYSRVCHSARIAHTRTEEFLTILLLQLFFMSFIQEKGLIMNRMGDLKEIEP